MACFGLFSGEIEGITFQAWRVSTPKRPKNGNPPTRPPWEVEIYSTLSHSGRDSRAHTAGGTCEVPIHIQRAGPARCQRTAVDVHTALRALTVPLALEGEEVLVGVCLHALALPLWLHELRQHGLHEWRQVLHVDGVAHVATQSAANTRHGRYGGVKLRSGTLADWTTQYRVYMAKNRPKRMKKAWNGLKTSKNTDPDRQKKKFASPRLQTRSHWGKKGPVSHPPGQVPPHVTHGWPDPRPSLTKMIKLWQRDKRATTWSFQRIFEASESFAPGNFRQASAHPILAPPRSGLDLPRLCHFFEISKI